MPVIQTSERPQLSLNVASPNTSCNQHKNTNRAQRGSKPLKWYERRRSRFKRSKGHCQSTHLSGNIFCLYISIWCFELQGVSGTVEIQTQRTCNSLESEQRFNRPSRHQRRSQSPVVKIIHLERLVFSKH